MRVRRRPGNGPPFDPVRSRSGLSGIGQPRLRVTVEQPLWVRVARLFFPGSGHGTSLRKHPLNHRVPPYERCFRNMLLHQLLPRSLEYRRNRKSELPARRSCRSR